MKKIDKCIYIILSMVLIISLGLTSISLLLTFASDKNKSNVVDFGPKLYLFDFYGVSALKEDIWAVGNFGNIIHSSKDKTMFYRQSSPVTSELYDVSFVSPLKGWVVGRYGVILGTEDGGKTWNRQKSGIDSMILKACAVDETHAWAVGEWGAILYTKDGKTWSLQREKNDRIFNSVYFVDQNYGWVVGELGIILHTMDGGKSWTSQSSPLAKVSNFSVSFKDKSQGVISAMDGQMLVTTDGGRTWSVARSPTQKTLMSVQFINERIYAFGLDGVGILSSDGGKSYQLLNPQGKGVQSITWFSGCSFLNDYEGWIVGGNGRVLYTKDGGRDWKSPLKLQMR